MEERLLLKEGMIEKGAVALGLVRVLEARKNREVDHEAGAVDDEDDLTQKTTKDQKVQNDHDDHDHALDHDADEDRDPDQDPKNESKDTNKSN